MPENSLYEAMPQRPKEMSNQLFENFRRLVYTECGINLSAPKKTLLHSRLLKRLRALNISSFEEYWEYLASPQGRNNELVYALEVISTNKTDFFRESSHFNYLTNSVLPNISQILKKNAPKNYTCGARRLLFRGRTLYAGYDFERFLEKFPEFEYTILGTDISQKMLSSTQKGIYNDQAIEPIPGHLRRKYLLKGKGTQKGNWRIVPELRNRVQFKWFNLMEKKFIFPNPVHIIFCRNVIIYFDRQVQSRLFKKFYQGPCPRRILIYRPLRNLAWNK